MSPRWGFSRRSSPAFAVGGLGYEPDPREPMTGWTITPYGGWSCFQCGERFTDWQKAEIHFGPRPGMIVACQRGPELPLDGC